MAFSFQHTYDSDIEELMRQYHRSLSEKDRRRFAAMEAIPHSSGFSGSEIQGRTDSLPTSGFAG